VPWQQAQRLLGLGWWLRVNGQAIYGTRPWTRHDGWTTDAARLRFTCTDDYLYAHVMLTPTGREITLLDVDVVDGCEVTLLGHAQPLGWRRVGAHLTVTLPVELSTAPVHTLRISLDA
jgi:alpha-L-fucosidase